MTASLARRTAVVAAAVGLGVLVTSGAFAAIPGSGGVYTGCYSSKTGQLRVIDAGNEQCKAQTEKQITWNEQGVPGPQGPKGDKGNTGPVGPAGKDGSGSLVVSLDHTDSLAVPKWGASGSNVVQLTSMPFTLEKGTFVHLALSASIRSDDNAADCGFGGDNSLVAAVDAGSDPADDPLTFAVPMLPGTTLQRSGGGDRWVEAGAHHIDVLWTTPGHCDLSPTPLGYVSDIHLRGYAY